MWLHGLYREHLNGYQDEFKCPLCQEEHGVPKNGFQINKKIFSHIEANKHLNGLHREAQIVLNELEEIVEKYDKHNIESFVYDHFFTVRNKLDLHRELMIKQINEKYEETLSKLNEVEKECSKKSAEIGKIDLKDVKNFLSSLRNEFRKPNLSNKEIKSIFDRIQSNVKSIKRKINENINQTFNNNLINFKSSNDLSFGKLVNCSFDFDNQNTSSNYGELKKSFDEHYKPVNEIQIDENSNFLISCSDDLSIKIWDLKTGECLKEISGAHSKYISSIQLLSDNNIASGSSSDKNIKIWDFNTLENLYVLNNKCGLGSMCLLKDDELLCGLTNGFMSIWDLNELKKTAYFKAHYSPIYYLKLTNDSKKVISAAGKVIKIWSKENLYLIRTLEDHPNLVIDIDMKINSCDELFSCSGDKTIRLWNLKTGQCLNEFKFDDSIFSIKSLPNDLIAIGFDSRDDSNLIIYDLNEKKIVVNLIGHTDSILDLKLMPNENELLSSSSDGSIKLWQI